MDRYFKPRSLTWWASVAPLFAGVIKSLEAAFPGLHPVSAVIDAMSGDIPAPVLINMGLIGIGLRGAMQ